MRKRCAAASVLSKKLATCVSAWRPGLLGRLEVHRTHLAAIILLQVVADALVLAEAAHPGTLDGRDVDEGVVSAAVGRDEAVAFLFVEEFHSSDGHFISF